MAYQVAFGLNVALQIATLVWFATLGPFFRFLDGFSSCHRTMSAVDAVQVCNLCEQSDDETEW